DEIEKAHPRILDKFLQVLDDGRLTDGLGETVYFSQSVIVFTSNIGASGREIDGPDGAGLHAEMTYEQVAAHFREAVRRHFFRLGRPELLGRIGEENIIVFDQLRTLHVSAILDKFLQGAADSLLEKHGKRLVVDPSVHEAALAFCRQPEVLQ